MLDSVDKMLLRVKTIEFYETPSVYHSNTTLYGGGGKLGMEKCEKSAIRSNNFGNDCSQKYSWSWKLPLECPNMQSKQEP